MIGDFQPQKEVPEIPRMRFRAALGVVAAFIVLAGIWLYFRPFRGAEDLLVVGYDSSREYITEISQTYASMGFTGEGKIQSQHVGSVQQAENIIDGLLADVVLLASPLEMDQIQAKTGCFDSGWQSAFPHDASPLYSTIVFLVRKGNPHRISDWQDLYDRKLRVAMPDPRFSGAGRYAYLALVGDALSRYGEDSYSANEAVRTLLLSMKLIPAGAQSAFAVFARNHREDVLLTWESEAQRITRSGQSNEFEVIYPKASIKAEPVVAIMECQTRKRDTTESAHAFVSFLFSPAGQRIALHNGLRPRSLDDPIDGLAEFPPIELWEVEAVFGTWAEVWETHLGPNGTFHYAMKIKAARDGGVE